MTPAARNVSFGLLFLIGGLLVTFVSTSAGGRTIVAYGAVLVGLIQLVIGTGQYLFRVRSPVDEILPQATSESRALILSVIAAAEVTGSIDPPKVALIKSIVEKAELNDYRPHLIDQVIVATSGNKSVTIAYLQKVKGEFTSAQKNVILRFCAVFFVMSDSIPSRAPDFLVTLRQALDIWHDQFLETIDDLPISLVGISDSEEKSRLGTVYAERANTYLNANSVEAAYISSNKAIELDPSSALAFFCRGAAQGARGNNEQSVADCSEAIRITTTFLYAYVNRAWALLSLRRIPEALADAELMIKRWPRNGEGWEIRGRAYEHMGQREKAIAEYRAALAINPKLIVSVERLKQLA